VLGCQQERHDESAKTAPPISLELANAAEENRQVYNSGCQEPERERNDEERGETRPAMTKTGERKKKKKSHQPRPAVSHQKPEHYNEQVSRPAKFQNFD
jgi:hypothetical protein